MTAVALAGTHGVAVGGVQLRAKPEIAGQGLKHMLPRTGGVRAADFHRPALAPRSGAVRDDAVRRPVAADDVPGARGGAIGRVHGVGKKGLEIGMRDDLRAALGGAVGIIAAQMIGFPIAPHPLVIAVGLVAGDAHHRLHGRHGPHGLKHVEGAQSVDLDGGSRIFVGGANERLRRQMEHDLRLEIAHGLGERLAVPHVAPIVADARPKADHVEMRRRGRHGVRKAGDFRAHVQQPRRQPRALESGVPGDEHPAACIDMTKHRLSLRK